MNNQNEENLQELFEKFFDSEGAKQAAEDIQEAEKIFSRYPASEPDEELISQIKDRLTASLLRRKASIFRRTAYKAAVAAAVILLAIISVKLFERSERGAERFASVAQTVDVTWEGSDIIAEEEDTAILEAEIEQIESEIAALQLGGTNGNGDTVITELEMKLIEIDSYFWKG